MTFGASRCVKDDEEFDETDDADDASEKTEWASE